MLLIRRRTESRRRTMPLLPEPELAELLPLLDPPNGPAPVSLTVVALTVPFEALAPETTTRSPGRTAFLPTLTVLGDLGRARQRDLDRVAGGLGDVQGVAADAADGAERGAATCAAGAAEQAAETTTGAAAAPAPDALAPVAPRTGGTRASRAPRVRARTRRGAAAESALVGLELDELVLLDAHAGVEADRARGSPRTARRSTRSEPCGAGGPGALLVLILVAVPLLLGPCRRGWRSSRFLWVVVHVAHSKRRASIGRIAAARPAG